MMIFEPEAIFNMANRDVRAFSDVELLALMLSGEKQKRYEIAYYLLDQAGGNFNNLARIDLDSFTNLNGVTKNNALKLASLFEISRRRLKQEQEKKVYTKSSSDVYNYCHTFLKDLAHEEFWVLALSRSHQILKPIKISVGGTSGTVVDTKILFKRVINIERISSIILVHNHPSGNIQPSEADKKLTNKIKEVAKFLDLPVLDHLIYADTGYYSFADEGIL